MAAYPNTTIIADAADPAGFMGKNVDAGFTATMQDLVGVYTEAYLCNLVKYDIVTNWAAINAVYKLMFSEYACRTIAIEAIKWDINSYTDRIEAEDMLTIERDTMLRGLGIIKQQAAQDFIDGA